MIAPKNVVEVVSDAAGQGAERVEFLGLTQLLFQLSLLTLGRFLRGHVE